MRLIQLVTEAQVDYVSIETDELPQVVVHAGRAYLQGSMLNTRDCYFPARAYFTEDNTYDRPD